MAVFGIPTVHEDDALRAVRAANEMRAALRELNEQLDLRWGVRLQARTGVNTGEVIVGDPSQGEDFVSGEAVNRRHAARAVGAAAGDPDRRADARAGPGRGAGAGRSRRSRSRGRANPCAAFRLLDVAGPDRGIDRGSQLATGRPRARAAGAARGLRPHRQRGNLRARDRRRTCRCRQDAAGERLRPILGRRGHGGDRPLPLIRAGPDLLAAARDRRGAGRDRGRRQLRRGSGRITAPVAGGRRPGHGGRARRGRARGGGFHRLPGGHFWAVRKLLEAVAGERPLVVVLEDVQWAEPTFLELIEYLADDRRLRAGPDHRRDPSRALRHQDRISPRACPAPGESTWSR